MSALLLCPLTPDTQILLSLGSHPTWVVPPEGNEWCSGKSAPKPQPAHILAVGSHQSLFTGAIFSIKESCVPRLSALYLSRVPLTLMTCVSVGSDPSWKQVLET